MLHRPSTPMDWKSGGSGLDDRETRGRRTCGVVPAIASNLARHTSRNKRKLRCSQARVLRILCKYILYVWNPMARPVFVRLNTRKVEFGANTYSISLYKARRCCWLGYSQGYRRERDADHTPWESLFTNVVGTLVVLPAMLLNALLLWKVRIQYDRGLQSPGWERVTVCNRVL